MDWRTRFSVYLSGKSKKELTAIVDYCYAKANSLNGQGSSFSWGKHSEVLLWREKARMAIDVRKNTTK